MSGVPTHPSLRSAAGLTAAMGVSCLLMFFFVCLTTTALLGPESVSIYEPEMWLILGVLTLLFVVPGVVLMSCVRPITRAGKTAVTVALVFSSLATLACALAFAQAALRLFFFMRFMGRFPPPGSLAPFVLVGELLAGFIVNVVKLARCYRVIDEIRYGGRRGFEPLVASTGEPPPPSGQWPDITQ